MRINNTQLKKNISNILLIQLGDIGDVVLSLPSIRALRENFPSANIVVAVREKAKELIEECRWVDQVFSVNKQKRGLSQEIIYQRDFFSRLRKFHFDLAIDLRTDDRGAILAFLSGADQRIGYYAEDGKLWRNRVFTHLIPSQIRTGQHMAEYYLNLLISYNIRTEHIWPEITISPEKNHMAINLLNQEGIPLDRPIIAIQPFSLWQYKEWGKQKFSQLINWIESVYHFPVILTGSKDERERADEIVTMSPKNAYNFAGKTSIDIFPALLKRCSLFIGIDSAGMHIASAVGTPTISIFGPGSAITWAPRGKNHCVVNKNFPCIPCKLKGCNGSEYSRCLEELTTEEVAEAVRKQIRNILNT